MKVQFFRTKMMKKEREQSRTTHTNREREGKNKQQRQQRTICTDTYFFLCHSPLIRIFLPTFRYYRTQVGHNDPLHGDVLVRLSYFINGRAKGFRNHLVDNVKHVHALRNMEGKMEGRGKKRGEKEKSREKG